jgi:hypothetical protein
MYIDVFKKGEFPVVIQLGRCCTILDPCRDAAGVGTVPALAPLSKLRVFQDSGAGLIKCTVAGGRHMPRTAKSPYNNAEQ